MKANLEKHLSILKTKSRFVGMFKSKQYLRLTYEDQMAGFYALWTRIDPVLWFELQDILEEKS